MKIIAIAGQKGGSGKTTLAVGLAVAAHVKDKANVAIIDLDSQTTATMWSDRRGQDWPFVVSCQIARFEKTLAAARENGADLVFVDIPGKGSGEIMSALRVADAVVIPMRPQIYDLETLDFLQQLLQVSNNPTAMLVVNQAPIQGKRHLEMTEIATQKGFEVAPVVLFNRAAHGDAANQGLTALEVDPDGKAAQEMLQVYKYIRSKTGK